MPPAVLTWQEVESKPEYKRLPPEEQAAARRQYFLEVVAPKVPPKDKAAAYREFWADTSPKRATELFRQQAAGSPADIQREIQGIQEPFFPNPPLMLTDALTGGVYSFGAAPLTSAAQRLAYGTLTGAAMEAVREHGPKAQLIAGLMPLFVAGLRTGIGILAQRGVKAASQGLRDTILEGARAAGVDIPEENITNFTNQVITELGGWGKLRTAFKLRNFNQRLAAAIGKAIRAGAAPSASPALLPFTVDVTPSAGAVAAPVPTAPPTEGLPSGASLTPSGAKFFSPEALLPVGGKVSPEAVSEPLTTAAVTPSAGIGQVKENFLRQEMESLRRGGLTEEQATAEAQGRWEKIWEKLKEFNEWLGEAGAMDLKKFQRRLQEIEKMEISPESKSELISSLTALLETALPSRVPARQMKSLIRRTTGQIKVGNLLGVDDRTALREVLRYSQRATKKAFQEGRKEGISAQKIHEKTIREAQQARERLRNEIKKRTRDLRKPPPESVPVEYKKRILEITEKYDLVKRSAKALRRRERLRQYIARRQAAGQPVNVPPEQRRLLDKKPLNDMTIEELRALHDKVMQLRELGRTKARLLKAQADRQLNTTVNQLTEKVRRHAFLKPAPEIPGKVPITETVKRMHRLGKVKETITGQILGDIDARRTLEALDNYDYNGPNVSAIHAPLEQAANVSYVGQLDKTEMIQQAIKQFKIDIKDSAKRVRKINDHLALTGEELMEVYLSTFDQDKLRHLMLGNRFSGRDIQQCLEALTPEERAYIDWERANYWQPQYQEIAPVFEKLTNEPLPQIPGYSHIRIDKEVSELPPFEEELLHELMGREQLRIAYVERGFTKLRKPKAMQPLNLHHWDNLLSNVRRTEHFKAFALPAKSVRRIINHPRYKKAIESVIGQRGYEYLKGWFEQTISDRLPEPKTPAGKVMRFLRERSGIGMIGGNIVTAAKQPMSFAEAIALTDEPSMLKSAAMAARDFKALKRFVYARSPQLRKRRVERDIEELYRQAKAWRVFSGRETLSYKAMWLLREMDKITVITVWNGAYIHAHARNPNIPEAEAIAFADDVVNRTQPVFNIKDLPPFFRGGELEKALTMYRSMPRQNFALFVHDILGKAAAGKISKPEALRRLLWIWIVPAVALGTITRGRFRRTGKEVAVDLVRYSPVAGMFLFGNLLESMVTGWEYNLPVFAPFTEATRAATSKKPATRLKHAVKSVGYFTGIPTAQPYRTAEGVYDLLTGKTSDLRRLIWSKYALREPKELAIQK